MNKPTVIEKIILAEILIGLSFLIGYTLGINRMSEIHRKIDCENKFMFEPANTVTADCIKYFK